MKQRIRERALRQLMDNMRNNIVTALPHELRTSIMVVQGYSGILLDDANDSDPEKVMMIETIQKYATRLHNLSEKFYWYSVTELLKAGHEILYPVEDAAYSIQSIAYEIAGENKRLEDLKLAIESAAPHVQQDHFEVMIREIIENAFKFSSIGDVVSIYASIDKNSYVIQVTDDGRGMKAKQVKDVNGFMQFERDEQEQQGTGLGLTIAMRLAQISSGSIAIDSQESAGTEVSIRLPLL
jgi:two-component system, sensor histidine kinase and response regulator